MAWAVGAFGAACTPAAAPAPRASSQARKQADPFAPLEAATGGHLGVAAIDLHTGAEIGHRADQRFAMCSTFKWVLAARTLAAVDPGELSLTQEVVFGEKDLLEHAPTTRASLAAGRLSVEILAGAIVTNSDNTAANLLLPLVGGPAGLTAFVRKHGDAVTRFDRDEPSLNTNLRDDPRDTTTPQSDGRADEDDLDRLPRADEHEPRAIAGLARRMRNGSRAIAGRIAPHWAVGDKTGTGERSAAAAAEGLRRS